YASNVWVVTATGAYLPASFNPKGTSNTIIIFERSANNANTWSGTNTSYSPLATDGVLPRQPSYPTGGPAGATAFYAGGALAAMGDGSARSFPISGGNPSAFGYGCQPGSSSLLAPPDF